MFIKALNNPKGMVLHLVLIVIALLSILGLTILSVSMADARHGIRQENNLQAYYIAKSGAQVFADYIVNMSREGDIEDLNQLVEAISNNESWETAVKDGSFKIETFRTIIDDYEVLEIKSTGYYKGASDSISLTLKISALSGNDGGFNPSSYDKALIALSDKTGVNFELNSGAFLEGDVIVNTTKQDSVKFSGGGNYSIRNGALYLPTGTDPKHIISTTRGSSNGDAPPEYKVPGVPDWQWYNNWAFWLNIENGVKFISNSAYPSDSYPELIFPDFNDLGYLPVPSKQNIDSNYTIKQDGHYSSIKPMGSTTVYVDMAGKDRVLRVGSLDLSGGHLELINAGPNSILKIYVDNYFTLGSDRTLNSNGIPDNVHIYYAGTNAVNVSGSSSFKGNLFIKRANFNFTAGANLEGNIATFGPKVSVTGGTAVNVMVFYAPKARFEMGGSSQIRGTVIADTFIRSGGGNAGIIAANTNNPIPGDFFESGDGNFSVEYVNNPWK